MPTRRFLPEQTDFFISFRAAATTVAEAAGVLNDLVTGQAGPTQAILRLRDLEHQGDEITHEIFTALARNLIAPLAYEDIRALARQLDDVTDAIDAVGRRLALNDLLPTTPVAYRLTRIIDSRMCEHGGILIAGPLAKPAAVVRALVASYLSSRFSDLILFPIVSSQRWVCAGVGFARLRFLPSFEAVPRYRTLSRYLIVDATASSSSRPSGTPGTLA